MTTKHLTEPELDQHLRRTLQAVAATIDGEPTAAPKRRRLGRRTMVGLGAVTIAVPMAAGAFYGVGSEYVDKIPPDNVIVAGSIDENRYWLVESSSTDDCGNPEPGAELVVEDRNILGREWNTLGITYGDPRIVRRGGQIMGWCGYDVSDALADPARSDSGGSFVDDTFLLRYAVHPAVTALRVTIDGSTQRIEVHSLNGAGYAIFEVPADSAQYTVELLIDGEVVPGSRETRAVPEPR